MFAKKFVSKPGKVVSHLNLEGTLLCGEMYGYEVFTVIRKGFHSGNVKMPVADNSASL